MNAPLVWCLNLVMLASGEPGPTAAAAADPYADNACVECHRDLAGRSSQIVELEWKQSVHYANGVACDGCHGGDPSARREHYDSDEAFKQASHRERNPDFLVTYRSDRQFVSTARGRSVSYFCGKCHAEIKEKHLGSPHGDFGDPTCLYCHGQGSHQINKATHEIIDTRGRNDPSGVGRCSPCHVEATMNAVKRIKTLLADTEGQIDRSVEQYEHLEEWGYRSLELEKLTHHVEEVNSKLRRVFHSFNMREINNFTAEIQAVADRTDTTYKVVDELRRAQRQQTFIGTCAVVVLLCFAGLLVYYKHTFLDKHI